jgi:hypothetical protein
MIDKSITRFGIGLALLLMVAELTYINAKSLLFMVQEFGQIDQYFSVIGSLAYSLVTIVIMRTSERQWPKIAFPLFDVALVFCGFNLKFYDAIVFGTDNNVRFALSIFLALFTGFITYCLGIINYEKHVKTDTNLHDDKINSLARKLDARNNQFDALNIELGKKQTELNDLKTNLAKKEAELNNKSTEFKTLISDHERYKTVYYSAERSRILKKSEKNRTPEELEILNNCQ